MGRRIQAGAEAQQRRERERMRKQREGQASQQVSVMLLTWYSQVYRCVDAGRVVEQRKRRESRLGVVRWLRICLPTQAAWD